MRDDGAMTMGIIVVEACLPHRRFITEPFIGLKRLVGWLDRLCATTLTAAIPYHTTPRHFMQLLCCC